MYLQIGHRYAVQHVVTGLLDGTKQIVQSADVDARLLVGSQHGVRFPTTWKATQKNFQMRNPLYSYHIC